MTEELSQHVPYFIKYERLLLVPRRTACKFVITKNNDTLKKTAGVEGWQRMKRIANRAIIIIINN